MHCKSANGTEKRDGGERIETAASPSELERVGEGGDLFAHNAGYGRSMNMRTASSGAGRLRILPPGVRGTASTTVNSTGTLYGERARPQCARSPSRSQPESRTISAHGTSPR